MGIDGSQIRGKRQSKASNKNQQRKTSLAAPEEKSLPLAIGLNFVLPGAGYIYLGKPFQGILALFVVGLIIFTSGLFWLFQTWIGLNVIMVIDMIILSNKRKKDITAVTTMQCPQCAETIKQKAKLCRFCGHKITAKPFI